MERVPVLRLLPLHLAGDLANEKHEKRRRDNVTNSVSSPKRRVMSVKKGPVVPEVFDHSVG